MSLKPGFFMKPKYPLEQLITIKKRRIETAEKALKKRKEKLKEEQEKEQKLTKERDKTYQHRKDKMTQLREGLDSGVNTNKIKQMKTYLKIVEEELKEKEKAVEEQTKEVKKAEEQVEIARKELIKKQRDLEKINMHRKEWEKETRALLEHQASLEIDELGTAVHTLRKPKS
ncbi:MAG: type III secretion T3S chaperone [Chlamydiota bacterium]